MNLNNVGLVEFYKLIDIGSTKLEVGLSDAQHYHLSTSYTKTVDKKWLNEALNLDLRLDLP